MTSAQTVVMWAFICHPQFGSEGGLGWNWAHALARVGHDVHLVTMPTFRTEIEEQLSSQINGPSVKVHFTRANDKAYARGHKGRLAFTLDYLGWQKDALRESRRLGLDALDVGHHVSWGAVVPGSRLAQLGPPFVFGPAGGGQVTGREFRGYIGRSFRETARDITVRTLSKQLPAARRTAMRTDLLLAANAGTETLARQLGIHRVERMLPDGIEQSLLAPTARRSQRSHEPIVLWVGRFLPRKGAPLAVEAFEHIRRAVPTARLMMIGEGETQAETQSRARELGLSEAVVFTGKIDWSSTLRLYDDADVLLYTSIRDTSSAPGMEAAARGLPIVALSHSGGGCCDDYPDVGTIKVTAMPTASVASRLGQAVIEVLNDDDYQRRSKTILEFAAENTWDAKASKVSSWYAKLDRVRG